MSEFLRNLNPEQQQACLHDYGPMLILAGAGSGKTTTLVARTGRLIDDKIVKSENICVLTFTNKAARELKTRVVQKLGAKKASGLWTGTFHAFGVRTLKKYHKEAELPKFFGILDQQDSIGLIREILKDFKIAGKDKFDADQILSQISRWREMGKKKSESDLEYDVVTEWILPKYEKRKNLLGVIDFDDLILKVIDLFKENPELLKREQEIFKQVMVDEFQDTNHGQMKLIDLLVQNHKNISVVGDDDQSIYGWRGAQVQNILDFPKKYRDCHVIKLERNYRSTPQILNLANEIISKNKKRYNKSLIPKESQVSVGSLPEIFRFDLDTEEIDGVVREIQTFKDNGYKNKDIAVLFRANAQGAMIETTLRAKNIPYKISGGMSFLERKEIKDVHSYLKCTLKPNDIDYRRIFNTPARGLGETTIEKIVESSKKLHLSFYKSAHNWMNLGVPAKTGETIDSLHQFLSNLKQQLLNSKTQSTGQVLLQAMEHVGYRNLLNEISRDQLAAQKRWGFIEVYTRMLDKFIEKGGRNIKSIEEFVTSLDLKDQEEEEEQQNQVQLMTLHACKGLEFPCVILMGVEEDILPHKRLGSDVFEERRLFYVGVTRAQNHLLMTYSQQRQVNGRFVKRLPSRFIEEIDSKLFIRHMMGARPVNVETRKKMLSDLMRELGGS